MIYSSKTYLALSLLMSAPLIAMDGGVAIMSRTAQEQAPLSFADLMRIEKDFFLRRRAEYAKGTKKIHGPADIEAEEIEMMQLEASELARLIEHRYVFIQDGSEFEGWLIRALDRNNRYKNSLIPKANDDAALSAQQPKEAKAVRQVSFVELMRIEKEFHLKKRAEFEKGDKKIYGPADIDADEIEMMELEASEYAKLEKNRLVFFQQGGSDFEGWVIRACDRRNRYKNWLKKQEEIKQLEEASNN